MSTLCCAFVRTNSFEFQAPGVSLDLDENIFFEHVFFLVPLSPRALDYFGPGFEGTLPPFSGVQGYQIGGMEDLTFGSSVHVWDWFLEYACAACILSIYPCDRCR
jgi:hypothetical protein